MKNKIITLIITIFFCTSLFAKEIIHVTHFALKELLQDLKVDAEVKITHEISGDAHDYEPDINVIKNIKLAKRLISAPMGLHPWLKNAINKNGSNLILQTSKDLYTTYPQSDSDILGHFWIYPEALCQSIDQIQNYLVKEKISFNKIECHNHISPNLLKGKTVVISHDAFEPLFKKYGANVISLMGSGHHGELKSSKLKYLWEETKKLKTQPIYWIKETGIKFPSSALLLKKSSDIEIQINTDKPLSPIIDFSKNILAKFK